MCAVTFCIHGNAQRWQPTSWRSDTCLETPHSNVVTTTLTNESQVHELAMPILYSHWWAAGLSSIIDTTAGLQMRTSSATTLQSVCHLKTFLLYVFLAFKSKIWHFPLPLEWAWYHKQCSFFSCLSEWQDVQKKEKNICSCSQYQWGISSLGASVPAIAPLGDTSGCRFSFNLSSKRMFKPIITLIVPSQLDKCRIWYLCR